MENMVSVVVPVYNSEKYIEETLISITNQSYKNIEFVIVDDGSSDSSGIICDEWSKEDGRITVIHTDNKGPSAARNLGISVAKGKYILPVDSDDIIESTYVEEAAKVLDENYEVGIVYCRAELIGDRSGEWILPKYTLQEMLVKNCIFATAMFRKSDWSLVGGYSEVMEDGLEDYDLWLSIISLKRKVYQLPDILFKYRKHLDSRSQRFEDNKLLVKKTEDIRFKRHRKLYEELYYIPKDKLKIALYGAGGAGETYYGFLNSIGFDGIKCCVDKNYSNIDTCYFPFGVNSPTKLLEDSFDQVVVAISSDIIYEEVCVWLINRGYDSSKIVRYYYKDKISGYM